MTAWNTIALPYAHRKAVTEALRAHLSEVSNGHPYRKSWAEAERITGRELASIDLDPEDRAPRRFACFERTIQTQHDLAVFVDMDGRRDLSLAAALSRATGGFAIAAESWRLMGRYGLSIFYAGALIQAWVSDCGGSDDLLPGPRPTMAEFDIDAMFRELLASTMSLEAQNMHGKTAVRDATPVDLVTDVVERSSFDPHVIPLSIPVSSVFFADVSAEAFQAALEDAGARGGWSVEHTVYGVPYGLLVGAAARDEALWLAIQRRLETAAFKVSIDGRLPVEWALAGHFFSIERGEAYDAKELLEAFTVFADVMRAQPGDLRIVGA